MNKYLENVRKYVENPNEDAVESLVGYLGIALEKRDSASVAASDPSELARVRDGYCSRTLDLDDETADRAIQAVCERMSGDGSKCRVTFYYLLAVETDTMHRVCG